MTHQFTKSSYFIVNLYFANLTYFLRIGRDDSSVYEVALSYRKLVFRQPDLVSESRSSSVHEVAYWHVSLQILQNINTSHQHSKNYIGFLSNKESITKSVFPHTKHLQINNLHIFTIVFHFRHILFLHDLLIHLFFPFHMSDHHLAKGLSLSSVHDFGTHFLLIPGIRLLYQYSVPGSKHTSSKLRSLPRLFPISFDYRPGFLFLLFSFSALSNDT